MGKKNQQQIGTLNVISDAVLIFASYLLAMLLRYRVFHGEMSVNPYEGRYLLIMGMLSLVMAICYRTYKKSYVTIAIVNLVGTLLIMAMFFLTRVIDFSRGSLVLFWLVATALVILKHVLGHRLVLASRGERKVLVVGSGDTASRYLQDCETPADRCDPAELEAFLSSNPVDEIIIALDARDASAVPDILAAADKEGLYVSMIPFFSEYIPAHPEIEAVGRSKLINLRATPLDSFLGALMKRLGDILGSLFLILLTSPLMLISAIGVRLSSPGPILFRQERIGKDKKPFYMLKFRSMRVNARQDTGWSTASDPRRTKFGSFIRKYSIDELPQFFNVLKGDMSLVGPRPEVPFYVNQFKETVPLYLVRQQVRPGITGWAQIHGLRGDTSIADRVEYDIWYIENWSLWLDIRILFLTVFGGKFKNEEQ